MIPMSRITEHIYIGSIGNAGALEKRNPENIEYILNCTEDYYRAPKGIKRCWFLSMPDESACHYSIVLFGVYVIHKAVKEGKKILVHCKGGVSRSRALVAAYFVLCENMTWDVAANLVLKKRRLSHSMNPAIVQTVKDAIDVARRNKPSTTPMLDALEQDMQGKVYLGKGEQA